MWGPQNGVAGLGVVHAAAFVHELSRRAWNVHLKTNINYVVPHLAGWCFEVRFSQKKKI
jgi:hypothetical protein